MIKTELKYWESGYQTRGGGKFKTLAFRIWRLGVMICNDYPWLEFYWLR